MVRVCLLPTAESPLELVTAAAGDVDTSEGMMVVVGLPAEEASGSVVVPSLVVLKVPGTAVRAVDVAVVDGEVTTRLVVCIAVADLVKEEKGAGVVAVSGTVDGGGQN
jgi:hypothetical protein